MTFLRRLWNPLIWRPRGLVRGSPPGSWLKTGVPTRGPGRRPGRRLDLRLCVLLHLPLPPRLAPPWPHAPHPGSSLTRLCMFGMAGAPSHHVAVRALPRAKRLLFLCPPASPAPLKLQLR